MNIEFSLCPIGRIYIPRPGNLPSELEDLLKLVDVMHRHRNVTWFRTKDYSVYRRLSEWYPHPRYSFTSQIYFHGISTSDNRF
ncbi:hypothetical protein DSM106972_056120 [Dulcicalothrix desertica PCC 7102]|uniref:Uncharacterized protein n=1 Tax=Dulcicalothrix desertica PCC 7102 TaxID=232991 RepID=A0A433V997_9CYAN|nr:hypothetical protein [Dulcicalothrix desertica]RUT02692.1 hypothetical protein DSM106972_056120 [Dulcicalothrix desertica PCC 7102]TWH39076.1 hypothetical protein CAL7102_08280 [Dulcicalothrix desertica PCC 7102]